MGDFLNRRTQGYLHRIFRAGRFRSWFETTRSWLPKGVRFRLCLIEDLANTFNLLVFDDELW